MRGSTNDHAMRSDVVLGDLPRKNPGPGTWTLPGER